TRTVASGANAGRWAYVTDSLGSVRDIVNWSSQAQDHLEYTGFGVATDYFPAVSDRYAFTAREYDVDTGLQYNRARYYAPSIGRWTAEDPIGFDGGDANFFRDAGNNPTNAVDPEGNESIEIFSGSYPADRVRGYYGAAFYPAKWTIRIPGSKLPGKATA